MSYERAYVNCERCFNLINVCRETGDLDEQLPNSMETVGAYGVRNEALRALEQEFESAMRGSPRAEGNMRRALKACMTCDFSKASICDLITTEKLIED